MYKLKEFYSERVFPKILSLAMDNDSVYALRKHILSKVEGKVLEIGIGEGMSLAYYPEEIKQIWAIEPNKGMYKKCEVNAKLNNIDLKLQSYNGKELPFKDEIFDTVVIQFALCSIRDRENLLKEIQRVLKVGGKFVFIEHGRSNKLWEAKIQDLLAPIYSKIACGCHINEDYIPSLREAGFSSLYWKRYKQKGLIPVANTIYEGWLIK